MTEAEREDVTKVPCPKCKGQGFLVVESTSSSASGRICGLCMGLRVVTPTACAAWVLENPGGQPQ